MKYRTLGKTGIKVSEIGFGTWGIGGVTADGANSYGVTDDTESKHALRRAFELGINFFDTADIYGYGHSEELLGEVFEKERGKVVIASKVGFVKHRGPHDLSEEHIRRSIEGSLRRLRTDYLDLYQLHSPSLELLRQSPEAIEVLRSLKKEGKIRAFGISVAHPDDGIAAAEELGAGAIQINFNLTDQRALENGFFSFAEREGVGVIIRTPLVFGFLSGKITNTQFDPRDHRSVWPAEQLKRWQEAAALFRKMNEGERRTLVQFALKFCLSFNAVSTVIPGMLKSEEVEENARASDLSPLSEEELSAIWKIYSENVFFMKNRYEIKPFTALG